MNPLWCVLLPVAVEVAWAVAVLPRIRRNLRTPEDAPAKLRETRGDLLLGLVFAVYHWPLLLTPLLFRRSRRIPLWAIVACLILTAGFYVGLLLLLVSD